jgi:hypothetical protein
MDYTTFNLLVEDINHLPNADEARLTYIRLSQLAKMAHERMAELQLLDEQENAQDHLEYLW